MCGELTITCPYTILDAASAIRERKSVNLAKGFVIAKMFQLL